MTFAERAQLPRDWNADGQRGKHFPAPSIGSESLKESPVVECARAPSARGRAMTTTVNNTDGHLT